MSAESCGAENHVARLASGALALVVGPSGAGKDALINGARAALTGDARFVFPDRIVTRPPHAAEDHTSMTATAFQEAQHKGAFALTWEAHGLCYGVPATIDCDIAAGRVAIVNGSRTIASAARRRYARTVLILVECPAEIRAIRIAARGRESAHEIEARLNRGVAAFDARDADVRIDNDGTLDDGIARLISAVVSLSRDP